MNRIQNEVSYTKRESLTKNDQEFCGSLKVITRRVCSIGIIL